MGGGVLQRKVVPGILGVITDSLIVKTHSDWNDPDKIRI